MKEGRGAFHTNTRRGSAVSGNSISAIKRGCGLQHKPQEAGHGEGGLQHGDPRGDSSEETKRGTGRPLHKAGGSKGGGRYIKQGAAVAGGGQRRCRWPLQRAGGGDVGGRYRERAAAEMAAVTESRRWLGWWPLHIIQRPEGGGAQHGSGSG
jgi:hypothetical protein